MIQSPWLFFLFNTEGLRRTKCRSTKWWRKEIERNPIRNLAARWTNDDANCRAERIKTFTRLLHRNHLQFGGDFSFWIFLLFDLDKGATARLPMMSSSLTPIGCGATRIQTNHPTGSSQPARKSRRLVDFHFSLCFTTLAHHRSACHKQRADSYLFLGGKKMVQQVTRDWIPTGIFLISLENYSPSFSTWLMSDNNSTIGIGSDLSPIITRVVITKENSIKLKMFPECPRCGNSNFPKKGAKRMAWELVAGNSVGRATNRQQQQQQQEDEEKKCCKGKQPTLAALRKTCSWYSLI